jgi:hypothetical protein
MTVPSQACCVRSGRILVPIWLLGVSPCCFTMVRADVTFSVNSTQGVHSISPYI